MKRRVSANPAKTQNPTSQSQRKRKKHDPGGAVADGRHGAAHRRQAVLGLDQTRRCSTQQLVGELVRAAASCPHRRLR